MINKNIKDIYNIIYGLIYGPIYLVHFITDECNLHCRHCFVPSVKNYNNTSLTTDEIKKIIRGLPSSILTVLVTGGEPFIRDDIDNILFSYFVESGIKRIHIATNGYFYEKIENVIKNIFEKNKIEKSIGIVVSIDGNEKIHNYIRKANAYKNAIITCEKILELKKKYHNIDLYINTTISFFNKDQFENLKTLLKNLINIDNWFLTLTRGKPNEIDSKNIKYEIYEEWHKKLMNSYKESFDSNKMPLLDKVRFFLQNEVREQNIKILKRNKRVTKCYAGKLSGVIYADGSVSPCEFFNKSIRNLKNYNYSIQELWRSNDSDKIRKEITKRKCFCT